MKTPAMQGPPFGWRHTIGQPEPGIFAVPSFSRPGTVYLVNPSAGTCTCASFTKGGRRCKHLVAVAQHLEEREGS